MRVFLTVSLFVVAASLRKSSHAEDSAFFFHRRRRSAPPYENLGWRQHFERYMEALMKTSNPEGFNPKAKPYIAEPQGTSRGLVLLQHGFTNTPAFFYLLTPQLVQQGWTVMAPLYPGHGRNPRMEKNGTGYSFTDWVEDLPAKGEEYEDFSKELMEIARKYREANPSKEMVLNGVSHGGAVAAYMAMNGEVGTWDRVLLMNPFLSPPHAVGADYGLSFLRKIIPRVLPAFKVMNGFSDRFEWASVCSEPKWPGDPRQGGSGGYCGFKLVNMAAVLEFGNLVEGEARARAAKQGVFTGGLVDRAKGVADLVKHLAWQFVAGRADPPPSNLKVQVLATSGDTYVSNGRIHFAAAALRQFIQPGRNGYCVLEKEFDHTYINPHDKPLDLDMWWLDSSRVVGRKTILDKTVGFLSEGELFPWRGHVEDDRQLKGDPRCDIKKV